MAHQTRTCADKLPSSFKMANTPDLPLQSRIIDDKSPKCIPFSKKDPGPFFFLFFFPHRLSPHATREDADHNPQSSNASRPTRPPAMAPPGPLSSG